MNNWHLLVLCTVAWLAWIPAVLLEKKAKGDSGGTSIVPVVPLFPLAAWLAGIGLNRVIANAGTYIVGGLHVILIVCLLGSMAISVLRIRVNRPPATKR